MNRNIIKIAQTISRKVLSIPFLGFYAWRVVKYIREKLLIDEEFVVTYDNNIKIRTNLDDHMESRIFWQGFLEGDRGEMLILDEMLRNDKSQVFFDIGAHVGIFSLFAAKRIPDGRVHSFEPLEKHLKRIRSNIKLNSFNNILVRSVIIGEKEGREDIHVPIPRKSDDPLNSGSGGTSIIPSKEDNSSHETYTIDKSTLDIYVKSNDIERIDIMKIDVEGAELNVLNGARKSICRFRPHVLMELDKRYLNRAGKSVEELLDFWDQYDFSVYKIGNHGSLSRITSASELNTRQNILADPGTT